MKIPLKDILYVAIQFILFISYIFNPLRFTVLFPEFLFWFGLVIFISGALVTIVAVLQLNVNLSPFPSPFPGSKLIESGVYKWVRHPIYTGLLMAFLGFAIISDSGYRVMVTFFLYVLFHYKSLYEERKLSETFPQYSGYIKRTGRFLPRLW